MKISVLMPCYNAGAYLGAALESVFAQQVPLFEVVFIDDGSTDGSGAVAAGFGPRVQCHRQLNQGIASARNRALSLARGEVIAFLDADDLWPAGSLRSRVEALEAEPPADAVAGMIQEFISPELPDQVRTQLTCQSDPMHGRLLGAALIRRGVFDRVGGLDASFRLAESLDWMARAEFSGVVMRTLDQVVLQRRIHASSTGSRLRHHRDDYLRALRATIDRRRSIVAPRPTD